ncbi:MAG: hypothetical protein M3R15_35340 [Acidobacteriota bacterium]|nr:hypothetical protein [Acidobacteriota bacterium]
MERQTALPLVDSPPHFTHEEKRAPSEQQLAASTPLSEASLALLEIITELPSRYYPEQSAASVGEDRIGLAGWIIDRVIGLDADLDEATAKLEIIRLTSVRHKE